MFDSFSDRISEIFEKLRKSGALKESDVDVALREIRIALLEADVSLEVAKKFIVDVREKAIGQEIVKSISPGQMVTKIVYDHLVDLLGKIKPIDINKKPYKIMLVGLQGAGKTTTAGKLAKFFTKKDKKVMLASTDIYRPAAIEQLRLLAKKIDGCVFAQSKNDGNLSFKEISKSALQISEQENVDVLVLDTAGRLHIDDVKMEELVVTQNIIVPDEILLVVDIMTGQDAFNIARKFSQSVGITGIILTRVDGDARGGVALSMRALTNCDIKFLCTGERLDDIEFFDSAKIANRLLGMGDIVSLVEKAQENFSQQENEEATQKLRQGIFTFDDLANQMEKMSKLGGLSTIVKMLPKSKFLEKAMNESGISDKTVARNLAIIKSMTKKERRNYKLLNGSRKKRIAAGSGTVIQDVNKLIKQYEYALDLFKKLKKQGGISKMASMEWW
ncbi:MAG: signal recognition particle protein [Holosporaceae bacterium]|jgi:signal recognition particle subunit SRP54|nr:signal recognition particle protein [Holosporaceae bacterium]